MKYLIIHCAASHDFKPLDKAWFERVHKGALDLKDGRVRYMSKAYPSRGLLPEGKVGGVDIRNSYGRGWDRFGYTAFINPDGKGHLLTPHDEDDIIDSDEMTWGASGHNSHSRHICLVGGYGSNANDDFFDHYTTGQFNAIIYEIAYYKKFFPDVEIIGHNNVAQKACPGFDVKKFLVEYNDIIEYIMKKAKKGVHCYG